MNQSAQGLYRPQPEAEDKVRRRHKSQGIGPTAARGASNRKFADGALHAPSRSSRSTPPCESKKVGEDQGTDVKCGGPAASSSGFATHLLPEVVSD